MIPLCERTVIAGKYRLERELAVGGMGAIWVARHLQLDELVAVKFMRATSPELVDARARFAREARAAARLRSPHVVEVLDHGVDGDLPYIVMELLEGEHLGDRMRRERRLSLRAAATIAAQVGKALGRAHRAGIVHRDLKPANVFLARLDDEEIVKILDFGIHKTLYGRGSEVTGSDVLMGSPQYMSPEQARGSRSVDQRADLWSLGAILFRAVTGAPAFDGVSAVDVIVQICTGPVPVASRVATDLPPIVDAFFVRAMARDPERRFSSAREMTEAFAALVQRVEAGEPRDGARRSSDSGEELLTFVMENRGSGTPRLARPAGSASSTSAEIDAFVERAFSALLQGSSLPAYAPGSGVDSVPPTTRCPPGRSGHPPPVRESGAAARPRAVVARLSPGSFNDAPHAPRSPPAVTGLRAVRAEERGAVAVLIDEGFAALRRGERDSARRAWEEALGRDPENRTLALNLRRLDAIAGGGAPRPA